MRAECLRNHYLRTPAMMFQVGAHGEILEVSDTFLQRSGYARQELVGHPVTKWIPSSCRARASATFRQLKRDGIVRESPLEMRNRDGRVREVLVSATANFDEALVFVGARGLAEDVTERNDALRQLERERRELHRRNHELDDFARVISHDLREPLRAISLLSGWIETDLTEQNPTRSAQRFEQLRSRVYQLGRYVEKLTAYVCAGRDEQLPETVDLQELVLKTVAAIVPVSDGFRLEYRGDAAVVVTARAPLEQVLVNLVGNAIGHHDRGEGRIEVSVAREDDRLRIGVRDDGPGIDPRFHDRIFEMGTRFGPKRNQHKGMGMSLVRKLVDSHGGTVRVESFEGQRGTLFEFTWSLARAEGEGAAPQSPMDFPGQRAPDLPDCPTQPSPSRWALRSGPEIPRRAA